MKPPGDIKNYRILETECKKAGPQNGLKSRKKRNAREIKTDFVILKKNSVIFCNLPLDRRNKMVYNRHKKEHRSCTP